MVWRFLSRPFDNSISLHIFFSLICQIFQTLRLFKALRLLPTCPTSIPDSRVRVLWASKSILIIQYIKFKVDPGKIRNLSYKTITLLLPDSNAGTMKRKANTLSIDSAGKDARIILFLKLFSQGNYCWYARKSNFCSNLSYLLSLRKTIYYS